MRLKVCLTLVMLLSIVSCNSRVEESKEQQKAAEEKLQEAKRIHEQAEKIRQQKMKTGQQFDSSLEGFDTSKAPPERPVDADKLVELLGGVAVWGRQPGTIGSAEGMIVQLYNKDKGRTYTAFVDANNRFKVSVTPGRYSLTINQPGYELYQEEINVDGRLNSQLLKPIGLKNIR